MTHRSLFSFGDSFTFGTDLADCTLDQPSPSTWPGLMADNLGLLYQCHAQGGQGNQKISSDVIHHYSRSFFKNRNFYVINWSWFERFDYIEVETNQWATTHPRHHGKIDHFFYRNIDSQEWNLLRNLTVIAGTIHFLQAHCCDFFMTCLDDMIFTRDYHIDRTPEISALQDLVRPHIHLIDGQGFYTWAKDNGYMMGVTGHPLESAHIDAFKYYRNKINLRE